MVDRLLLSLVLSGCAAAAQAMCPVSSPEASPVDVPGSRGSLWFGSEALAVDLPPNGRWIGMGAAHRYRNKTWFWRRGYEAGSEPRPDLEVTGVNLGDDEDVHTLSVRRATNAFGPHWQQMLVLVEFPAAGCWQLTARYFLAGIRHDLTFVVDVIDRETPTVDQAVGQR
jgi:hypothetical protein